MTKKRRTFDHGDQETRLQNAYRRLGTDNPKCLCCDEADPFCLELHHVEGREFGDKTVILCLNHHRKISDAQKDQPPPPDCEVHSLERFGRMLIGLAELLVLAVEALKEIGLTLIRQARELTGQTIPDAGR